jgi:hypothetical protein
MNVLLSSCNVRYEYKIWFHSKRPSFKLGGGRCPGSECYGCMATTSDSQRTRVGTASFLQNKENSVQTSELPVFGQRSEIRTSPIRKVVTYSRAVFSAKTSSCKCKPLPLQMARQITGQFNKQHSRMEIFVSTDAKGTFRTSPGNLLG